MNKSVVNKIVTTLVSFGVVASLTVGSAATAQATIGSKSNKNTISSEYSKKNGWKVFYGDRRGAWVAEDINMGGLAVPKNRSSKKVSLKIESVDSTSRETRQDYRVSFKGFDSSGVRVEFVDSKKLIPVQVFNNVHNGDVLNINVDDGSGDVCGGFYVFVKDTKKNWAIQGVSTLYTPN
jgi:hypothetical protein